MDDFEIFIWILSNITIKSKNARSTINNAIGIFWIPTAIQKYYGELNNILPATLMVYGWEYIQPTFLKSITKSILQPKVNHEQ